MGDVQSTQRGARQDAAAGEESRDVDNPQTEQNSEHKTFNNSEQSSEISRKEEEVKMNGCHEDENGAQGLLLIPTKEAAPETQKKEEKSQEEGDAHDGVHLEITEVDVKQNDINSLGRFFSNIGLKLTIKRGSGEKVGDDLKETDTEESEETKTEKTEDKSEEEAEQDSSDPTCPILTAVGSENVLESADKTTEATEEPELKAESEQEAHSTNPTGPEDVEIDSPIRRFFATGIFAGLWKKKEAGDETTEKELEEMEENEVTETTGQAAEEQRDEEPTAPDELRDEVPGKSPEPDILGSQERDRVPVSPLLRFLSGSSLKRLSMKQRNIKSSDARLCDTGEDPAELLPAGPAEEHGDASAPTSAEAAKEDEGAWASFKRFMSPKTRVKKPYHSAEESQQPASAEEPRAEQTSDHSSEEGKKRKNSSVSWEAVLCGSGRRRSRKTSDSEDEMPPIDLKYHKRDGKPKSGEESGAENEKETTSPKPDGSPQEEDGGSTWKSLKRIVTPKRKSRDEDEAIKIKTQSDGEGAPENSSFSIKNLLPGRKKQRSEESQGRASSDEAEKDLASDEEDSETPGVVPLSEFDVDEDENECLKEKEKSELQQDQGSDVNLCLPQDFGEDAETQDTNEGPDDVTESAGKDQELSDIPEEGVITEAWATLTSLTDEAEGRDGTMLEDLIGVTSEAITAPEPAADLTLQDETEMFTAASQFSSESATTSGNATPVPAERHIIPTDEVLLQVAETFSTSPETTTPEPEEAFEGCVKKESTILEMHRRSDATSTETGLDGEDLEAASGLLSAPLGEASSEVAQIKLVGFGSGVASEEFDSTDHTEVEDEERRMMDVQNLAKELAEALVSEGGNETGEKEIREAGDETLPLTEASVGAEDAKQVQEPEIDGPVEGLGPSLEPKVIDDNISMCLGTETGGEKPPLEACLLTDVILEQRDARRVEEPEDLQAEFASSLNRQEGSRSSLEPQMISENLAPAETATDEAGETHILTETVESAEAPQEPEVLQAVQASTTSEEPEVMKAASLGSEEENVLPPETQIILTVDLDTEEDKIQTKLMTEDTSEPLDDGKNVCLAVHPTPEEPEHPSLVKEAACDHVSAEKPDEEPDEEPDEKPDEPKQEAILSDTELQSLDSFETVQEAEVSKVQQSLESEEPEIASEIILTEETVPGEPKEELKLHSEITLEPEEPSEPGEAEVLKVLQQSLESEETKEEPPDNISGEETVPDEPRHETTVAGETSSDPVDRSKTVVVEELETVETSSFMSEDSNRSTLAAEETSVNIPKVELDAVENQVETVVVMVEASEARPAEEQELSQVSSLESEDNSIHSAEPEITSQIILTEETVPDEPGDERDLWRCYTAGETRSEPADDSKTAEAVEELETVETSSLVREERSISPYEPEETSENTESDKDENKAETMFHTEYLTESEDAARVLKEAEELKSVLQAECPTLVKEERAAEEPEDVKHVATESLFEEVDDFKTFQTSSFESEESRIPSSGPEVSSENVLKAELDTDQHGTQTTFITADTSEPPDDPQNIEGAELSPTVQPSSEETEKIHVSSLEAEEISENILKAETVPHETDKEIMLDPEDLETVEELESEHPSLVKEVTCDHVSEEEPVPDESKQEPILSGTNAESVDPSETVEEAEVSQVLQQSLESEESKGEPSDNISEEQTVPGEPRDETTLAGEPVDDSKSVELVEEPTQTVPTSSLVSEESSRSTLKAEETSSQSVQSSSGQSEDNSVPSAEPEITSEIILTEETVPDEPKEELKLHSEITLDPEEPSEPDGEAEVLKDVHSQLLESEESRGQSPEREVTSDNVSEETTDKLRDETTAAGETSSDPVDDSKTAEVVELETVETSSLVKEESSISPYEPEETSKNILKAGSDVNENKVETSFVTEEQPEFCQTVQSSVLESEDTSVHSAEPEITSEIILIEEAVPDEPGDGTAAVREAICGQETAEDVKELQTVQTSSQEYKSSSPPLEVEETSDISKAKTVSDETKEEITLDAEDTESADESEALTAVNPTPESEHPSLANDATCAHISGEEMVPGEPKEKTIYETLDCPLSEVFSKPGDAQEPQVLKTVQATSFELAEASNETEVTPDNLPKSEAEEEDLTVETTTDDLKTEQVKDDKCSGTETETVEDEDAGAQHVDKCHSKDASEAAPDVLREQTSDALMDTMQAEEAVKEQVEAATPSAKDGVAEEVEEGKAEDTVEVAVVDAGTTSEGTTVDSVLEVEEMEVKDVTDVCCRVVHAVESLSATTELEKEQILEEDKATTEEEKVQVDDEVEEKESPTVQATEASHSLPVTKAKQVDQDEWMDAEENIDNQEETAGSFYKAEEPPGSQRGDEDADQAGLEREVETAHASRSEGEGSEETNKADEACGFESEEEDFEVAQEHPGSTSTAAVTLTG